MTAKQQDNPSSIPKSITITDTLDLHGFFPEQIPEIVTAFLENAIKLKLNTVQIIHGKGKSRLKWEVYQVLKHHPHVTDFYNANPESGGWGATVILLDLVK